MPPGRERPQSEDRCIRQPSLTIAGRRVCRECVRYVFRPLGAGALLKERAVSALGLLSPRLFEWTQSTPANLVPKVSGLMALLANAQSEEDECHGAPPIGEKSPSP